jgi:hypothetical protein
LKNINENFEVENNNKNDKNLINIKKWKLNIILILIFITNIFIVGFIFYLKLNYLNNFENIKNENISLKNEIINLKKEFKETSGQELVRYTKSLLKKQKSKIEKERKKESLDLKNKINELTKNLKEVNDFVNLVAVETNKGKLKENALIPLDINKQLSKLLIKIKEYNLKQKNRIDNMKSDLILILQNNKEDKAIIQKNIDKNIQLISKNNENIIINSNSIRNNKNLILKNKNNINKQINKLNFDINGDITLIKNRILNIEKENTSDFSYKTSNNNTNNNNNDNDNKLFFSIYKIIDDSKFFIKEKNGKVFNESVSINDVINEQYKVVKISIKNKYVEVLNNKTDKIIKLYETD